MQSYPQIGKRHSSSSQISWHNWSSFWLISVILYLLLWLVTPLYERVSGLWGLNGLLSIAFVYLCFRGSRINRNSPSRSAAWGVIILYTAVFSLQGVFDLVGYSTRTVWRFQILDFSFFLSICAMVLIPISLYEMDKIERYCYFILLPCVGLYVYDALQMIGVMSRNDYSNSRTLVLLQVASISYPLFCKYFSRNGLKTLFFFGMMIGCALPNLMQGFRGTLLSLGMLISFVLVTTLFSQRNISKSVMWFFGSLLLGILLLGACAGLMSVYAPDSLINMAGRMEFLFTGSTTLISKETGSAWFENERFVEVGLAVSSMDPFDHLLGSGAGSIYSNYNSLGFGYIVHTGWAHFYFKFGIIGIILLVALMNKYTRRQLVHLKNDRSFNKWGYYSFLFLACIQMTYYGPKEFGLGTVVFFWFILNPELFCISERKKG